MEKKVKGIKVVSFKQKCWDVDLMCTRCYFNLNDIDCEELQDRGKLPQCMSFFDSDDIYFVNKTDEQKEVDWRADNLNPNTLLGGLPHA